MGIVLPALRRAGQSEKFSNQDNLRITPHNDTLRKSQIKHFYQNRKTQ